MSLQTATRRSPWITFALVIAGLWILFTWVRIAGDIDLAAASSVGQGAVSGIVGLVVMALALGFLWVLFGDLTGAGATPEPWPPRE